MIFGMAPERVKAALGLAFKDIAAEMADMELQAVGGSTAPDAATQKRRAYANDYLQKLVNIEIKVPTRDAQAAHQLLSAPIAKDPGGFWQQMTEISKAAPLLLACAALAAGLMFAQPVSTWLKTHLPGMEQQKPTTEPPSASTPAGAPPVSPPVKPASDAERSTVPAELPKNSAPNFIPGSQFGLWDALIWALLGLLPLLAVIAWMAWKFLRSAVMETKDSDQFREALEIWAGLVAQKNNTPRFIKRFGNRIRYLAMLQQGETQDETSWDVLKKQLRRSWQKLMRQTPSDADSDNQNAPRPGAIAEHQLIALGAIHETFGDQWREELENGTEVKARPGEPGHFDRALMFNQHKNKFSTTWPPSAAELDVFKRLLSGVRLSGDPQTVAPRGPEESPAPSSSAPEEWDKEQFTRPARKPAPAKKTFK